MYAFLAVLVILWLPGWEARLVDIMYVRFNVFVTSMVGLFGLLDCLTTVMAIQVGASELNPLMASVIGINLQSFVIVKSAVTICICLALLQADRQLTSITDKKSKAFKFSDVIVKTALISIFSFMFATVLNNFLMLSQLA